MNKYKAFTLAEGRCGLSVKLLDFSFTRRKGTEDQIPVKDKKRKSNKVPIGTNI